MSDFRYVWLLWASAFLVPWVVLYVRGGDARREMLAVSAATSLLGLTEPLFVPEYWNPPSLFDLASRTGFDVESLVFCFAIGGIGFALYKAIAGGCVAPVPPGERQGARHRFHLLALAAPFVSFPPLYALPWNPIYAGIAALVVGALANVGCRPDLARASLAGGLSFLVLYTVFMLLLIALAPGYVEAVWNLERLSGILLLGVPLEELAFGFAFGLYWAGLYEHFAWRNTPSFRSDRMPPAANLSHG